MFLNSQDFLLCGKTGFLCKSFIFFLLLDEAKKIMKGEYRMCISHNSLKNHKVCDVFAGIGGNRLGFEKNGAKCVFSSEINKSAAAVYEANFGDRPHGDITKINSEDIPFCL